MTMRRPDAPSEAPDAAAPAAATAVAAARIAALDEAAARYLDLWDANLSDLAVKGVAWRGRP